MYTLLHVNGAIASWRRGFVGGCEGGGGGGFCLDLRNYLNGECTV